MKLTSVQEAAFNAAGEAIVDLEIKVCITTYYRPGDNGATFGAFTDHPRVKNRTLFSDYHPTVAEAVQEMLNKYVAAQAEAVVLTAKEAVDAIRTEINDSQAGDGTVDGASLRKKLDALVIDQ